MESLNLMASNSSTSSTNNNNNINSGESPIPPPTLTSSPINHGTTTPNGRPSRLSITSYSSSSNNNNNNNNNINNNSNNNNSDSDTDKVSSPSSNITSKTQMIATATTITTTTTTTTAIKKENEADELQVDELLLCPICDDMIKEPFISKCGHSFCYQCITIHISKSKTCPICSTYLTREQIFPNFALNKFVEKIGIKSNLLPTPTVKQFRNTLSSENLSLHDINLMVSTLLEKKKNLEVHDQQVEYDILLDFLQKTKLQKMETFKQLKRQISYLENDIKAIENQKDISETMINNSGRNNNNNNNGINGNGEIDANTINNNMELREALLIGKNSDGKGDDSNIILSIPSHNTIISSPNGKKVLDTSTNGINNNNNNNNNSNSSSNSSNNNSLINKKRRVETHLDDLQTCYFSAYNDSDYDSSPQINNNEIVKSPSTTTTNNNNSNNKLSSPSQLSPINNNINNNVEQLKVGKGLLSFSRNLLKFTKYNEFKVLATLKYGDLFNTSSIVSSIEFDRDEEYFATAGVTKKIKIFEFSQIRDNVEVHSPVKEMTCRSKISCLSWNTYIKSQIASSDYEGIISLWDANTGQNIMTLEEHEKRVWSVDFSRTDPTQLASGSDDTRVKLWSTTTERAITTIESKANICCVKFNPCSSNLIAFGSADHHIHYYDLRQYKDPLLIFKGHRKAVSYVKFMSKDEIISASTDSTLKLWNVNQTDCVRTFTGHSNEKNFVGLTVNGDYICCGSENNGVYTYYKTLSKPIVTHRFGANSGTGEETDDDGSQFVSSVCWKKDSNILLAANSQGNIKILSLV